MHKILLSVVICFAFLSFGTAQENTSEPMKGIKVFPQNNIRSVPSAPNQIFNEEFQLTNENEFLLKENTIDNSGFTHNNYQQFYNNIRVEFAGVSLHNKEGNLLSMSYNVYTLSGLNLGVTLSNSEALNRATSFVGASKYLWEDQEQAELVDNYTIPVGELVVLPNINNTEEDATVAYKFDVYALEPLYRADVYVDAKTGNILLENQTMHEANVPATGESLYNGIVAFTADDALGNFRLRQNATGGGINTFDLNNGSNYAAATDITSETDIFSAATATGVQAHWGAQNTYSYFQQKHGRDSYDNQGSPLNSYVSYGANYVNAFWDGSRMTYGDGNGVNYGPLVPLDIVGHEIAHGVTQNSSNLLYQKESGALNESFSDIFGEAVENFASGSNDWLLGQEIGIGGNNGAFRSISNPKQFGDPDTYGGNFWINPNCSPSRGNDYCGVHSNSGVQNYWFYILSQGGTGTNDIGNNYAIDAIGMEKAAAIAYRNLTVYLQSTSTYNDARIGAIQAARDLYGFDSQEEVAVTNAWHAVGVGSAYGQDNDITSFSILDQVGESLIDTANKTVQVIMPSGTDRTSLAPTVVVSDGAIVTPGSDTTQDFTNPAFIYTVTSLSGLTQDWMVTVLLENEVTPPNLLSFLPLDNAVEIGLEENLTLVFDKSVVVEPGTLFFVDTSTGYGRGFGISTFIVSNVDGVLVLNPPFELNPNVNYYVRIDEGIIFDEYGNAFEGTNDSSFWNFSTITVSDTNAPVLQSYSPASNSVASVDTDLQMVFNEEVRFGTTNGVISKLETGEFVSHLFPNQHMTVDGNVVTVDIPVNLEPDTEYVVIFGADAVQDLVGNDFGGIYGESWTFTAAEIDPFVTTWKTDNPGISASNEISIPTHPNEVYDYTVDWGDGTSDNGVTGDISHTYSSPGTYTVAINGTFPSIYFRNLETNGFIGDEFKLLTIEQWGDIQWSTMTLAFAGCENLDVKASDEPDLTNVWTLSDMFTRCESLIGNDSFSRWNLSNVTSTQGMFNRAESFNQDIANWDVSNVQFFSFMFSQADDFNQDISGWDVSMGTKMRAMFQFTDSFDQDIGNWDMSNVIDTSFMFWQGRLSVENYDKILIGWSQQNLKPNLEINFSSRYCEGKEARQSIIDNFNWEITDRGVRCAEKDQIWLEAECAEVGSNWSVVEDANASAGVHLVGANVNFPNSAPTEDASILRFKFKANDMLYTMYGRVKTPTTSDDSFWFRVNGGDWIRWNMIPGSSEFSWHRLHVNENPNSIWNFFLTSEENILELAIREDGTAIDKLYLALDNPHVEPEAMGEIASNCEPVAPRPFVTTWKTDNSGNSEDNQITIPTNSSESYNYTIAWGDGTSDSGVIGNITHDYDTPGTYQVSISGDFPRISFGSGGDQEKVVSVDQWGTQAWETMEYAFSGCTNLDVLATDAPDLSNLSKMDFMFGGCNNLVGNSSFEDWDLSNVISTRLMFSAAFKFNVDIGQWNVSNVEDINGMFHEARTFDQDIGKWNVSSVQDMGGMFSYAAAFNQELNGWEVSSVTSFRSMFNEATAFNQSLNSWNVANATTINYMFRSAHSFNGDISNWDVSNLTQLISVFHDASVFNQDLGNWNVANVESMSYLFYAAREFNQDISEWDVSQVKDFNYTFSGASSFNQDIGNWDVSSGTTMQWMFGGAQDFNQNLGDWNVSSVTDMTNFFANVDKFSLENYDAIWLGWSSLPSLQQNVSFHAYNIAFCDSESARQEIIDTYGWEITDNGEQCALKAFITEWYTAFPGISEDNQITIPTYPGETYNYDVDWGDGTTSEGVTGDITHTYPSEGSYTVSITGDFPRIYFNNSGDAQKLQIIRQWGLIEWTSFEKSFMGSNYLGVFTHDSPDLRLVTSTESMFENCQSLITENSSISSWATSSVTNTNRMFAGVEQIIGDISGWDVQNVTTMESMFEGASAFNNDISDWQVDQVTSMKSLFKDCLSFNLELSSWNVSGVTDMTSMFQGAIAFDQDLGSWNVTTVQDMTDMFSGMSLSIENYDALLTGWSAQQELQNGVSFNGGNSTFCLANDARQALIDSKGWNILDAGLNCVIDTTSFITVWKTDNEDYISTSNDNQITIPTHPEETYNYNVNWGDGTSDADVTGAITHTYATAGAYEVSISGDFPRIYFNNQGDRNKIEAIKQWGDIQWSSMERAFYGCRNMDMTSNDLPDLSNVTSFENMFRDCHDFKANESIAQWNTSTVTNMSSVFYSAYYFDIDISTWVVNQVTDMSSLFFNSYYNQDISNWNVGNVEDMSEMFSSAYFFNQDLSEWNTGKVKNMRQMFAYAYNFNQPLDAWNVSEVEDMSYMFIRSGNFNQNLSSWNLEKVTNLQGMFSLTVAFNQDISTWNVSQVTNMSFMFDQAEAFNQSLGSWNMSNVLDMSGMFNGVVLSQENYDNTLIGWLTNSTPQNNVIFDAGNSRYCLGVDARQTLISDYGWSISDKGEKCPIATDAIWLEAECATVGTNWSLIASTDASEGQYVLAPQGNNYTTPPTDENDIVSFNFDAEAGAYKVYVRVNVPSEEDDSFWVRANGGAWQLWDLIPGNSGFSWHQTHEVELNTTFTTFDFVDGPNTLEFGHREDGAGIDKVFVTNTNEVPEGFGTSSSNCPQNAFITTWQTDIDYQWDNRITIPTQSGGYNYTIDWGDGNSDTAVTGDITHHYDTPGTYIVSITGDFPRIHFNYGQDRSKIISVDQWGDMEWLSMENAFQGCTNLEINATDMPDLSLVTSLYNMFSNCENLQGNISFNNWDVSSITSFNYMFVGAKLFNADISNWNVSNGIDFNGMFYRAETFNQNIGSWNLENAEFVYAMFEDAKSFNADIGAWRFPKVKGLGTMFRNAISFDQNISTWNVSNVEYMYGVFEGAVAFNKDISSWNVSNVQYAERMFFGATAFDQDLGDWNVSSANNLNEMFKGVTLSLENYDSLLTKWSALPNLRYGVTFDGGNSQYCLGAEGKQILVNNRNWTITDGGENCTSIRLVVDAGDNQTITLPATTSAIFNGIASSPDGEIVSYNWVYVSGPNAPMLTGQDTPDLTATGFAVGMYTFILTVVDDQGQSAFDEVTLQVQSGGTSSPVVNAGQDQNSSETSITLNGSGSDPDGGDVSYVWSQESGPNTADLANQNTAILTASNLIDGAYVFRLTVTDDEDDTTFDEVTVTITTPEVFVLRINAGGTEVEYNEETFSTDTYFNTGNVLDRPQTGLPEPYQTFRFSRSQEMSYAIPLEDGEYTVNLYFAELWFGATGGGSGGVGSRVFDVTIEGDLAEDNLDVFAEVGADAILMRSHTVTVTGGILDIDFNAADAVGGERHPIINAIEILGEVTPPVERPFVFSLVREASFYETITIPVNNDAVYDYTVDWGDGTIDSNLTGAASHTYTTLNKEYKIAITGKFPRIYFGQLVPDDEFDSTFTIYQWGDQKWSSFEDAFGLEETKIVILAEDEPDLSNATSLKGMFAYGWDVDGSASMHTWDVSNIENMSFMFWRSNIINADISGWDVSNVKDMSSMFAESSFNQNIGNWNVANVVNINSMFSGATVFNQDISAWNTSSVTNMDHLFFRASSFNQNLNSWDVSNVNIFSSIFGGAENFNKPIGDWNVSSASDMQYMFSGASSFNQDISNWDAANVVNMKSMFSGATVFNQNISTWDVSNVTSMLDMFALAESFDQNIGTWNIENVSDMRSMFYGASLSVENYDSTLIGWSTKQLQNGVAFDGSASQYCQGEAARQKLIDDFGWTITDAGKAVDCIDTTSFITTWKTDNPGASEDNQITIPIPFYEEETYNYSVDWGDGTSDSGVTGDMTHTYTTVGTYHVAISGDFPRIHFGGSGNLTDREKLLSVEQWGDIKWSSMVQAFQNCINLDVKAIDTPDLSLTTSVSQMFEGCSSLIGNENFNNWDVSSLTKIDGLFVRASNFNQPIGEWDVSNVNSMNSVFAGATLFNQPLADWNVSSVNSMAFTFHEATAFNQPLGNWDVSQVDNMWGMFLEATSFNQPIGNWNVGNVGDMTGIFLNASSFNQDLGDWDVRRVTYFYNMFDGTKFNHSLEKWEILNATNMENMFDNSAFSDSNYDTTLIGWGNLTSLPNNIELGAKDNMYCVSETARQKLIDDFGWTITDAGKAADCPEPSDFALRINTGGTEVEYNNETFIADSYFNTGNTLDRPQTGLPEPYQSFRFSRSQEMSYDIPLEDGEYTVNLYFAELWFGATGGGSGGVGSRVFDVSIEGELAEDNLDVFAEAGADAMLMRSHTVTVTDGILDIDFNATDAVGGTRHPIINAIEILGQVSEPVELPFVTTWKTDNSGISNDNQITIPTFDGETYNYTVDWGDGTSDSSVTGDITHTYAAAGSYEVSISGDFPRIYFKGFEGPNKLISVDQWGDNIWTSMEGAFYRAGLDILAEDVPNLTQVISMKEMFLQAILRNNPQSFANWDVSNVTDMSSMFAELNVNLNLSNWDVSNVTSMKAMFAGSQFNGDISGWDVGNVTNMSGMFDFSIFDVDISNWDVSSVDDFSYMFFAADFNRYIGGWNVSNASNLQNMFGGAYNFNQDIGDWDVSNVTDMSYMFSNSPFNQDISTWDVSKVERMDNMFQSAATFNQDLGAWNIVSVGLMDKMFMGVTLSQENYDSLLNGWSTLQLQNDVTFDGGNSQYCQGEEARQKLIDDFGWTITDAGKAADCIDTTSFITTWRTDNPGISEDNQITIPTEPGEVYNYYVDWGDGSSNSGVTGDITHTYAAPGIYSVSISGDFPRIYFNDPWNTGGGDNDKLISIDQWGTLAWSSMSHAFAGCDNLDVVATDSPNLANVTRADFMFSNCHSLVGNSFINSWDTKNLVRTDFMFFLASNFNQNIDGWDVENITNMISMFAGAASFDGDVGGWNVSNATEMTGMFSGASNFDQNIANWNVSKVVNIGGMFTNAVSFNQNIGAWDVSNVNDMSRMFRNASSFNQDIGNWNVENVLNMNGMFDSAISFDQNIQDWNIESVRYMAEMFKEVTLSQVNYDSLLNVWSTQQLQNGVTFDGGNSEYCQGEEARQKLIDDFGWTITDAGKTANCPEPNDFVLRINAGGTETGYNGETFVSDSYFNTGLTLDRPQTGLPEPFQTFRYSRSQQMSYDIPLEDGEYTVNLYFAELWFGATGGGSGGAGSRIFDVNIEGQMAEDNLDVFAEVGADAMLMRSHTVTVTGGVLDIDFDARDVVGGERHPIINGIEILGKTNENTSPVTSISATDVTSTSFKVDWTLSSAHTGQVQWGATTALGNETIFEPSFLDHHIQPVTGLEPATTYYYRVIGEDAMGTSFVGDIRSIKTLAAGSGKTIQPNIAVLSPNPVVTTTTLSFEKPVELTTIQVFDVTGRLVYAYEATEVSDNGAYLLNVNQLPAGTYFLKSHDIEGQHYQKQMVIKK